MVFVPSLEVKVQALVVTALSQVSVSHTPSLLNLIWLTPEVASVAVNVNVTEVELV